MSEQRVHWSEDPDWVPGSMRYITIDPPLMMAKSGTIWVDAAQGFEAGPITALISYEDGDIGVYRGEAEPSA